MINLKKNRNIYFISCFLIYIFSLSAYAQNSRGNDVLTLKGDRKIEATITEVTGSEIKYKKANDPNGPTFTIKKSELASVSYGNGEVEIFERRQETDTQQRGWDSIETTNGKIIQGRIIEITERNIRYRKTLYDESPVFVISKDKAIKITFSNGEIDNLDGAPRGVNSSIGTSESGVGMSSTEGKPIPKDQFQASVLNMKGSQLPIEFQYYKRRSKQGIGGGIFWTIMGVVVTPVVGAAMIASEASYEVEQAGAVVLLGGPLISGIFAATAWINAAKSGNKAKFIMKEMNRRKQSAFFQFSPKVDVLTKSAGATVRFNF